MKTDNGEKCYSLHKNGRLISNITSNTLWAHNSIWGNITYSSFQYLDLHLGVNFGNNRWWFVVYVFDADILSSKFFY